MKSKIWDEWQGTFALNTYKFYAEYGDFVVLSLQEHFGDVLEFDDGTPVRIKNPHMIDAQMYDFLSQQFPKIGWWSQDKLVKMLEVYNEAKLRDLLASHVAMRSKDRWLFLKYIDRIMADPRALALVRGSEPLNKETLAPWIQDKK